MNDSNRHPELRCQKSVQQSRIIDCDARSLAACQQRLLQDECLRGSTVATEVLERAAVERMAIRNVEAEPAVAELNSRLEAREALRDGRLPQRVGRDEAGAK